MWWPALLEYVSADLARSLGFDPRIEEGVDRAFWKLMEVPAPDLSALADKGRIMLREYGETGELRTDLVEVLLDDVKSCI